MKKLIFFIMITLILGVSNYAFSGTWSWSNSSPYSMGSYVPVSGSFSEDWYSGFYESETYFTLNSDNVDSITDYNNGDGGGDCYGEDAFLTVDISANPDSSDLEIDAYTVYSNLPNPVYDTESNWPHWPDNDESETVALGTVSAKNYYMGTLWEDYRDGDDNDGGYIQVQFAMSEEGFSDYNNCIQAGSLQIYNPYGKDYGDE